MTAVVVWSEWRTLEKSYVANLPQSPGIYQVSCQAMDCVVYVGSATGRGGLRQRLSQRVDNPKRVLVSSTGAMGKNIDVVIGRRFKKHGMSWTAEGANNLLKLRTLCYNKNDWGEFWTK